MPNPYSNQPPNREPRLGPAGSQRRVPAQAGAAQGAPAPRTPTRQRREPGEKNRWFRAVIMVVATIAVCIFAALYILDAANDLFGLNQPDMAIEVTVPDGSSNADVGKILEEAGIIKNSWIFRIYADLKTTEAPLQSGTYMFNTNLGYDEIIRDLRSGNNIKEEVRLSFAEGRTIREIAAILDEYNVCDGDEFIEYLRTAEYDYEFYNAMPQTPLRYFNLEGYIYPDTYDFYVGESVEDVARKFVQNFNRRIDEDLKDRMMNMNLSIDETIILASMIQREASEVEDMRDVSSVFHNRLGLSEVYPNLQSDVTIFYVNNNIKPYLQQTDQDMYDAYNTYVREGLPVGAICNPGMDAIRAALYPNDTDYYFFVTDTNGDFYYAVEPQEHYRNVATAKAVGGEAHGIDTQ